jgi:acyl carrier protein
MLLAAFQQVAAEIAGTDFGHVSEATRLSELAVDSIAMVEIVGRFEQRLRLGAIPDERLTGLSTVGDLLDVVEVHSR